ncbi:MAG: rod shape-determining protein MreC [Burkholderiaceae bacterium]|nr:rod shape-determining protein MreC [Burkholderiaceae bacterium]
MALGTLDRRPPPLFREGISALTKVVLCVAFAIFLMVLDARFKVAMPVRNVVATLLHPVQRLLLAPVDAWDTLGGYLQGTERAMAAEDHANRMLVQQAEALGRASQLQVENQHLRELLKMREVVQVQSQAAEVLYEAPDPYSRRLVIDRGSQQGIKPGSPVINAAGVIGQITRVYSFSSELTLLTDKDAAIPVLNTRTQQRGVAFGGERGDGSMELRFTAANADIQAGDVLSTSGLDGVYPPGLSVAKVLTVERRGDTSFARIGLQPVVSLDSVRHVLVLMPLALNEAAKAEAAASAAEDAKAAAERKTQARAEAKARSKQRAEPQSGDNDAKEGRP